MWKKPGGLLIFTLRDFDDEMNICSPFSSDEVFY